MTRTSLLRPARSLLSLTVLVAAYLLVMANSAPPECAFSEDFGGTFDVTTTCGTGATGQRTGRVRIDSKGVEGATIGEWQTSVTTLEGPELVSKVISVGDCDFEEPAEVRSLRVYLTENAENDEAYYVCASSVYGTLDTSCDEELPCVDCVEIENACNISLVPVGSGS